MDYMRALFRAFSVPFINVDHRGRGRGEVVELTLEQFAGRRG
jgi:hypothetical protein